jgi:hypothetical protein
MVKVEDRYQKASIMITSLLPVYLCLEVIGEKTIAEEILDRNVQDPHRVELDG